MSGGYLRTRDIRKSHRRAKERAPEDRAAQCEGKIAYPNFSAASAAQKSIHQRGNIKLPLNIYKCRFCPQWHIGQKKD